MLVVFVVTGSTAFRGYDRTRGDLEWLAWHLKELVTVAPPLDQSLDRVHLGREGNVDLIFRYPDRFREVVKRAQRDRKDILTSYVTLEEAWKAGGVDQVLTIQLIKLPSTDPYTGGRVAGSIHPPEPIQEANFEELGQLLKEIRTLILEGDGTGRGRLAVSGYQVEPMETQLPPRPEPAGENETESEVMNSWSRTACLTETRWTDGDNGDVSLLRLLVPWSFPGRHTRFQALAFGRFPGPCVPTERSRAKRGTGRDKATLGEEPGGHC